MKRPNLFAAVFLISGIFMKAEPVSATMEMNGTDEPYLLVASNKGIIRINMDGSGYQLFVEDVGVVAVDYHFGRDLLFWVTDFSPDLKFTTLSNKTGNITALNIRRINNPTGLAVDWLKDRVYWVEGLSRRFKVYDLVTEEISLVKSINAPSTPRKLKILPHLGLLFWGDRDRNGIFRIPVNGTRDPKQVISLQCPLSLTLNYKTGNIYTVDSCGGIVNSIRIDGSNQELIISSIGPGFVYGSSIFRGNLFWSQAYTASTVNCFNINMSVRQEIFRTRTYIFDDVIVVHSSNQPPKSELDQYGLCELVCHHGDCLQSGTCSCNEGWTGLECAIDIDECQVENGGCVKTCVNLPGTFQCECEDGEELLPDKKGCRPAEPGSHTTLGSTHPPTTSAPTTSSTHFPTTPFSTTKIPTTPLSTTEIPTTPLSSTETLTTPMSTTRTPTTPIIISEISTTPISNTETMTTPSNSSMDVTSSNDQDGTMETGTTPTRTSNSITDQTTTNNEDIGITETGSTQKEDDDTSSATNISITTPDEGGSNLQTNDSNQREALIIGVITFLASCVILAVGCLYILFLYAKYMKKKTGFYDTFKRHHGLDGDRSQVGKMPESDPSTMSVCRSFKDVMMTMMYRNRYSRRQLFEDVADSGCTGRMKAMGESPTHVQNFPMLESKTGNSDASGGSVLIISSEFIKDH